MISKGGLLKFVKYTLVFSNAFGFVLSIFLGLFGAAYSKKQFPLGYRGREMALCSLFCMLITTIGYCGAQNHNRILLIVYGASNVMIVIIVVILWFLFKENSILGNKDISNMFITTLAITIAVMFLFSFILAFHVDTLKESSQDSIVSQSHQLLQQTTALLQRQQQHHQQQLLMAPNKHHLPPATTTTTTTTCTAGPAPTAMNLQHEPATTSGGQLMAGAQHNNSSGSSPCALHQVPAGFQGETAKLAAGLHNPYLHGGAPSMQAASLVSPIQLLPPPPPMLKSSSRNKTGPHQPAHLQQALLSPPQVPQPLAPGPADHHQVSLMRNQSSPLPAAPGPSSGSSLGAQHGYGQLRGPGKPPALSAAHMHYQGPPTHKHQQHPQSQQCRSAVPGAAGLMSASPSPPPPPSMSLMHHHHPSMLRDVAVQGPMPGGSRGMGPPPPPPPPPGCPVQYCTFQCDRTV